MAAGVANRLRSQITYRIIGGPSRPDDTYPRLRPRRAPAGIALMLMTPSALAAQLLTHKLLSEPVSCKRPESIRSGTAVKRSGASTFTKTLVYYNDRNQDEVDDATLCPAITNVWLHPASKSRMRKSLLAH